MERVASECVMNVKCNGSNGIRPASGESVDTAPEKINRSRDQAGGKYRHEGRVRAAMPTGGRLPGLPSESAVVIWIRCLRIDQPVTNGAHLVVQPVMQ